MSDHESVFDMSRMPAQWAFISSEARARGYGGAMGGGKTRGMCEDAFNKALEYEGITILMSRQTGASIQETTKKCMLDDVVPPESIKSTRNSQGQDWIKLHNDSMIHFIGLEDPIKWFSAEIGMFYVDEAHEVAEDTVVKIATRLRQPCRECVAERRKQKRKWGEEEEVHCDHFPHGLVLGFNPENPGHWLYKWFIEGANIHKWGNGTLKGYSKPALYFKDADKPFGAAEFIFAKATDNVFLSKRYIETNLAGLPKLLRKRYLEGQWVYVSGRSFFDNDALTDYAQNLVSPPMLTGITELEPKVRLRPAEGPWWVWKTPVRGLEPHRYIIGVDVAGGTDNDYSAAQVIDIEEFEQVAEYQLQVDSPTLAQEVMAMARIYNDALIAPEITGGWGFTIISELQRFRYPRIYTRTTYDRLSKQWTDKVGWDTQSATRANMLDALERVLRSRELKLNSPRCVTELSTFVWPKLNEKQQHGPFHGIPQAQPGSNDDLVMALAVAVVITLQRPRQLREPPRYDRVPELVTGY